MTLLYQWLEKAAKDQGNNKAVVYRDNYLSWRGLLHRVDRRAQELKSIGITKDAWVGLMLGNVPDFVILALAFSKLGTVVVPIDPTTGSRELELMLQAAPLRALVTRPRGSEGSISASGTSVPIATATRSKPLKGAPPPPVANPTDAAEVRRRLQGTLLTCSIYKREVRKVPGDPIAVLFTADSLGDPKGVVRTPATTNAAFANAQTALGLTSGDTFLVASPLFHAYGWDLGFLPALRLGATILLEEETSGRRIGKILRDHETTVFPGTPVMFGELARLPTAKKLETPNTRFLSSGSKLEASVADEFAAAWGVPVLSCYHATESGIVAVDRDGKTPGSVGALVEGMEVRITVAEAPEPAPAAAPPAAARKTKAPAAKVAKPAKASALKPQVVGKDGAIWLRSKSLATTAVGPFEITGKPKGPVGIGELDKEGWLRTGDLGHVDKHGRLTLTGREDDIVKIEGKRVALGEIEGCLEAFAKVKQAKVSVVSDPLGGPTVIARIVLQGKCTADELIDHCARNLAPYKVPRRIEFLDAL
ncbi:MAG: acyl--CoA ligase [Myxococcales bacterium]|nr:acyl--CoA ligase [Myxococcales bacterium]